ncbi:tyrosine-type recombinase/integrase [Deminuibacter soli]|uniref:Core-binding (CB) domain-containing protein n=1 Tax=Deminuibacter soli TaxID=2291815 RepID=A0A3E1NJ26_9BACT|nr:site-specific integrase [Deminuibacter soli]RFM27936.1 hypothetical protein DXN05_10335 [Deminuibacter soli]
MENWQHKFTLYLQQEGYAASTITGHLNNLSLFIDWVTGELPEVSEMDYTTLMAYVQYERSKGLQSTTIAIRLQSIGHYFEWLKAEKVIEKNPVKKLHIKAGEKKIVTDVLDKDALNLLYEQYVQLKSVASSKYADFHLQHIVILGLLIWQGLHSGELAKLEVGHIQLAEAKIYIPSIMRSNSRVLALAAKQVITLYQYLGKLPAGQVKLFNRNVRNAVFTLMGELKGINPVVQNAAHIRSSVILQWLKTHNKRQVQYMIGHKYITSTEYYEQQELTKLVDQLTRFHPLG